MTRSALVAIFVTAPVAAAVTLAIAGPAELFAQESRRSVPERLRPGITVLLDDQLSLVRGRRIALVVDRSARDDRGRTVEALFSADRRARDGRVRVVATVRVDAMAHNLAHDAAAAIVRAGLDSLPGAVEAIVVDVLDRGTRAGPAPHAVLGALHAGVRRGVPVIVLDRPNPLTGEHADGPVADSIAVSSDALYGLPARHGMTIGEIALWFNSAGRVGANLSVVPVRGWRRSEWTTAPGAEAGRIGGVAATAAGMILSGALEPLAATNLSVAVTGPSQVRVSAPWLDANRLARELADRLMPGVRYTAVRDRFERPDGRAATMPSLRIEVTDRDRVSGWRVLSAVLAGVAGMHRDSLRVDTAAMSRISGDGTLSAASLAGEDSDAVVDRALGLLVDFRRRVRPFLLYR